MRLSKHISNRVRKFLPKWLVRVIVKLKGTGVLNHPKLITPEKDRSLRCTIAYNQFGSFCTPDSCLSDTPVQAIYRGEQYEEETLNYIQSLEIDGDIIHAGAYFGDSIPCLSAALNKQSKLWAFEPVEESYRCALITVLLNDLNNVEVRNIGLGNREQISYIKLRDSEKEPNLGGKSTIIKQKTNNTQLVHIKKLDQVIPEERKIAVLHFDVEGYEENVLEGATRIIKQYRPIIIIEAREGSGELNLLHKLGYKFVQGLEERENGHGFRNIVFMHETRI